MATLYITDSFETKLLGVTYTGRQGDADNTAGDPVAVTTAGTKQGNVGTLAVDTARTIWDEDADNPVDFIFLWFKADQDCYVQLIGATVNMIVPVKADVPVRLPGTFLAAASTTPMSGTEPVVENVDSVVIQNNSDSIMNYEWSIFL